MNNSKRHVYRFSRYELRRRKAIILKLMKWENDELLNKKFSVQVCDARKAQQHSYCLVHKKPIII